MQGLKYNLTSDTSDPNSFTSMNANDNSKNNCLCTLTRKRAVCFQTEATSQRTHRTSISDITQVELKMQIRFLSHGSTRSSRSVSDRLKYNLARNTIDPSSLLVKRLHIAHVRELLVAAGGKAVGSPPIPHGTSWRHPQR